MPVPLVLVPLVLVPLAPVPAAPVPFEPGSSRPLAAISRAPWSCSSCNTRPQQIVNMQDPHHLAIRPTTNSAVTGRSLAFIACRASAASASGPMVRGERVITSLTVRVSRSGPIARRRSPSVIMPRSDRRRPSHPDSRSVFRSSAPGPGPSAYPPRRGNCFAGVHQFAHAPQPGAEPPARMKSPEIRLGKASPGQQGNRQRVPQSHLHGRRRGGSKPIGQASAAGGSSNAHPPPAPAPSSRAR